MDAFLDQIVDIMGSYVPRLIGALAILIVGWLVAKVIASLIHKLLLKTEIDNRIAGFIQSGDESGEQPNIEGWISRGIFYLIMLLVLIAVFQTLRLTVITQPLNQLLTEIARYIPKLIGAGVLILLAWVVATGLKLIVSKALAATSLDERLGSEAGLEGEGRVTLSQTLGEAVYWLVFLFFLPLVLSTLELDGLLQPVQTMMDEILGFLPNLFGAGVVLLVGWFVAKIVQRIVTNLLAAFGVDALGDRVGLDAVMGGKRLSEVVGLLLYVLILIPVLIAALNTLGLDAITRPASNMLDSILRAIPGILGAALILTIAYIIARVVSRMLANLLATVGFDNIMGRLGLRQEAMSGARAPSELVGYLIMIGVMLFATIEAAQMLGFDTLAVLLAQFTVFAGQIVLGLIIFAIGLFLANLIGRTLVESGVNQSRLVAFVARGAILLLAGAMALRQMGLANEIVNLAFGLMLGAIAVASALAFGLGGRELAGRELERWRGSLETGEDVGES